jgi:hypothetical protein
LYTVCRQAGPLWSARYTRLRGKMRQSHCQHCLALLCKWTSCCIMPHTKSWLPLTLKRFGRFHLFSQTSRIRKESSTSASLYNITKLCSLPPPIGQSIRLLSRCKTSFLQCSIAPRSQSGVSTADIAFDPGVFQSCRPAISI